MPRSVKVKTVCSHDTTNTTLAHPRATPGHGKDASVQIAEILDVPADVTDQQVVKLWLLTADLTAYGVGGQRHRFRWPELGEGRIVCGPLQVVVQS